MGFVSYQIPATDRLEKTNEHGLTFGKISLTDYPEMAAISETDALPAFFIFADGKKKRCLYRFQRPR